MSGADHMVGPHNSQAAANNHQGSGAFAALNGLSTKSVAVIDVSDSVQVDGAVHVLRCYAEAGVGGVSHPRTLVSCGDGGRVEVVQQSVGVGGDWGVKGGAR